MVGKGRPEGMKKNILKFILGSALFTGATLGFGAKRDVSQNVLHAFGWLQPSVESK